LKAEYLPFAVALEIPRKSRVLTHYHCFGGPFESRAATCALWLLLGGPFESRVLSYYLLWSISYEWI